MIDHVIRAVPPVFNGPLLRALRHTVEHSVQGYVLSALQGQTPSCHPWILPMSLPTQRQVIQPNVKQP